MRPRLIARLDIKGPNLIKGVQMEGLRVMGDPHDFARRYYEAGIDELLYIDIVASLYGRSKLTEVVRRTARDVFVPLTVGGGIRTLDDVTELLRAGADKVAINTAAVANPDLIAQVARRFGSQCMVLSIEAKAQGPGKWEVFTETGRERSGLDVVDWVRRGVALGAGEVLVTSIDREGERKGYDCGLIAAVAGAVDVPIIASGGYGSHGDLGAALSSGADAVAVADALHYGRRSVADLLAELEGVT